MLEWFRRLAMLGRRDRLRRQLDGLFFEVQPLDPRAYATAASLLIAVAAAAAWLPARRAARIDPSVTLRTD